jgi:hypothetical protein
VSLSSLLLILIGARFLLFLYRVFDIFDTELRAGDVEDKARVVLSALRQGLRTIGSLRDNAPSLLA